VADRRDEEIAELRALVARQAEIITRLEARVAHLEARLNQNSSNSGKPPSSDAPGDRDERRGAKPKGKQRGGQPGHKGHKRTLLPSERVTATVNHFPECCKGCGHHLAKKPDGDPYRHQVLDVPEVVADVTEHQLHAVKCGHCGDVTRAKLPEGVPAGMCGPRLIALIGLLTGAYHLSRRQATALLDDILGIHISLGTLSQSEERLGDALASPAAEALEHVREQAVKHVDATGWRQGSESRSLWTIATTLVTVFAITLDGSREHLRAVLTSIRGILISDRAPQFQFWAMHKRQICWAHLLRKFVSFSEDKRPDVAQLGEDLLLFGYTLLHQWHRVRDGTLSRPKFRRDTMALRMCVENLLRKGANLRLRGVSGSCSDILDHRLALWTFIDKSGIEPTNNHAERELRGFVLWRKKSFGSQSERGTRFAARIMTAVHTLRKQRRHVLSYLTKVATAALTNQQSPSLLPSTP
jgi:transposase